jgi:hypothetical protein
MPLSDAVQELTLLVRSRHPLVVIEGPESERILTLLRFAAERLQMPLLTWSRSKGLGRVGDGGEGGGGVYNTEKPEQALSHIATARIPAIFHLPDLAPQVEGNAVLDALLKDAVEGARAAEATLFLTGSQVALSAEMATVATNFVLRTPSSDEFKELLSGIIRDLRSRQHLEVELTRDELARLLGQLQGLTLVEAEKILTKAIVEDGRLTADDIAHVVDAKKEVIEREGLLEYYPVDGRLPEIAALRNLRNWLDKRRAFITQPERAEEFGLSFPRGVLLLGVPGCGKSLSAKAVAAEWQLPLLKLDPSNLYNKYIGESERNFKRAVQAAEKMAPCVLWIDEIEKAFASGGDADGGVSQRILGSFLSWMQERAGDVFVVATANQIDKVPPELLRKGRFDEIFFVDLPDAETRADIFRIHLSQRGQNPAEFDLSALGQASDGFSGAEIEQAVISALYTAFADNGAPTTKKPATLDAATLMREVSLSVPLAKTMAERIERMRAWAKTRAVPAN